jgi:hypothetical protein
MTDVIDATYTITFRDATVEEKTEALVPDYMWMGVSVDGRTPRDVVAAGVYTNEYSRHRKAAAYLASIESWIRTFADESGLIHEGEDSSTPITLGQLNEMLATMGCEKISSIREYTFSATITYEVSGSVFAKDDDTAREHIEELMMEMGVPDINEPQLDGDGEEWWNVGVDYTDHEITDVSEA